MIINEEFKTDWFALPKELIFEYSDKIGAMGIALYAYLAASCDENKSCTLPDGFITLALSINRLRLRRTLQNLKDASLVKSEMHNSSHTTYILLW